MNIEALREYCLSKKGVAEEFPFGEETLVFKVAGKIFLLTGLASNPVALNVKCDPAKAIELREQYDAIKPGYHMNKKHWNTVTDDGSIPQKLLKELIDESYLLVMESIPKTKREEILNVKK
jgi:predicted DNA-binding protein (MmcQ/YjbR family)